ncbi:MAG: hypothetical protein ACXWCK_31620 [Burkholderiales bacterium]
MSEIQSPKEHARYVTACPVGCTAPLTATRIALPEGSLFACEKSDTPRALHAISKAAAELLSFPARLAQRGHDMVAYLRAQ